MPIDMKKTATVLLALSLLLCLSSCKEEKQAWESNGGTATEETTIGTTEETNDPASEETTSTAVWSPVV